jgi:hypothetical protein
VTGRGADELEWENSLNARPTSSPASTRPQKASESKQVESPIPAPKTQSAFHRRAQRSVDRRRDVHQQSRAFAPRNPRLRPSPREIDSWWGETITKSNQNVFASFFSLGDLERLKEPWPEGDKLRVVANAIDSGQIDNADDDIRFYGTMWERLERLGQLISLIDKKT